MRPYRASTCHGTWGVRSLIPLEGRLALGLDEFMLRLGHLKVACSVAADIGGPMFRVEKAMAEALTKPVEITPNATARIVTYLTRKKLCLRSADASSAVTQDRGRYRYPDLLITRSHDGEELRTTESSGSTPTIWWQDWCLAASGVRSRVGAVTAKGSSGSKTGVSHILDWADILGLVTGDGRATSDGRLLAVLSARAAHGEQGNPYIMGPERILLAYLVISADADLFFRFIDRLSSQSGPIRKKEATALFVNTVEAVVDEAEVTRGLSTRGQHALFEQLRDLRRAARGSRQELSRTSTAWHRTSSRMETYVDIGLLDKNDEDETYEYAYHATETLRRAVDSISGCSSVEEWLDEKLVPVLVDGTVSEFCDTEILLTHLPFIVDAIGRETNLVPIPTVAAGLSIMLAASGNPVTLGAGKKCVLDLARKRPDIARLARGDRGDSAEFVSIDRRRLAS